MKHLSYTLLVSFLLSAGANAYAAPEINLGDKLTITQLNNIMREWGSQPVFNDGHLFAYSGYRDGSETVHTVVVGLYGGRVGSVLTGYLFAEGDENIYRARYDTLCVTYRDSLKARSAVITLGNGNDKVTNIGLRAENGHYTTVLASVADDAEFLHRTGPDSYGRSAIGYYVEKSDREFILSYLLDEMTGTKPGPEVTKNTSNRYPVETPTGEVLIYSFSEDDISRLNDTDVRTSEIRTRSSGQPYYQLTLTDGTRENIYATALNLKNQSVMTQQMEQELRQHGMLLTDVCTWKKPQETYWNLVTRPGTDRMSLAENLRDRYPDYTFNPYREVVINNSIYASIEIFEKKR